MLQCQCLGRRSCFGIEFFRTMYMHMHIYTRRALFQNALSANPKIYILMPIPSSAIMFWTRALNKYVHIYACIRMWVAFYQNTIAVLDICIYIYTYTHSKTSVNRLTMGPTINVPFRKLIGLVSKNICMGSPLDRNKAIDIGEWLICWGSRLERFHCIYIFSYTYILIFVHSSYNGFEKSSL